MLAKLVASWNGVIVMMGDFNEVREAGERYGSVFKDKQVELFHDFITNASLSDTYLGGFNFTLTDKWGSKMSKLDQFLVSESFYEVFPHNLGVVLEKGCASKEDITIRKESIVALNELHRIDAPKHYVTSIMASR
ncbi:RNA-directed DNA polymerase, eukaryota, reverse transcriptase zinc-binding domain protein [Tanacetum coccineum]